MAGRRVTIITPEEAERWYRATGKEIMENERACELLNESIRRKYPYFKPMIYRHVKCLELCKKNLNDLETFQTFQQYKNELYGVLPGQFWETRIEFALDFFTRENFNYEIKTILTDLSDDCYKSIESELEFIEFKYELAQLVNKN